MLLKAQLEPEKNTIMTVFSYCHKNRNNFIFIDMDVTFQLIKKGKLLIFMKEKASDTLT